MFILLQLLFRRNCWNCWFLANWFYIGLDCLNIAWIAWIPFCLNCLNCSICLVKKWLKLVRVVQADDNIHDLCRFDYCKNPTSRTCFPFVIPSLSPRKLLHFYFAVLLPPNVTSITEVVIRMGNNIICIPCAKSPKHYHLPTTTPMQVSVYVYCLA